MTTALPKVSIVVPVFNAASFIGETIESLINQTYPNLQIVVIDDGSTDNSWDILQQYSNRVKLFKQKNAGQSAALNFGWSCSDGDFLSYLSADDLLEETAISELVDRFTTEPTSSLIYCDYALIDSTGKKFRDIKSPEFSRSSLIIDLICQPGPGILFRASSFKELGGWNTHLKQMPDFEYWLRLSSKGPFSKVPRTLASFRVHEQSQTFSAKTSEKADEPIRVMTNFFRSPLGASETSATQRKSIAQAYILSMSWHLRSGRIHKAFVYLIQAASYDITSLFKISLYRKILAATLGPLIKRMRHSLGKK